MSTSAVESHNAQSSLSSITTTKDWTLDILLSAGPRFRRVPRVSASLHPSDLIQILDEHEANGTPLIIEGWHMRPEWPTDIFEIKWLREQHGTQMVEARNVHGDRFDRSLPLSDLIDTIRAAPPFALETETERLYGKDMECPPAWEHWLANQFILDSIRPHGDSDLLSKTVQTLMCYLGVSDTFTPSHKDLCASTGHNMMCYTENGGSSFWFMTESAAALSVAEYFHELGCELDWESHVMTVTEFAKAPFEVYIAEQKLGDLIIVPPRSCHQVVNHGGITIKTSWSRMTLRGLEAALYHELPIYRRVCRPEVYRVKFTIYDTMLKRLKRLEEERKLLNQSHGVSESQIFETKNNVQGLASDLHRLIALFDDVLQQEFCSDHEKLPHLSYARFGSVCDFCGSDVFQSFFYCRSCGLQESLIICPACYVEGRTCRCGKMEVGQIGRFADLLSDRNKVAQALHEVHLAESSHADKNTISGSYFLADGLPIFHAACLLRSSRLRPQKSNVRCCTFRSGLPSHQVPTEWTLYCKGCHATRCFGHILEAGIHASKAILEHDIDRGHEFWHYLHRDAIIKYQEALPMLQDAIKTGTQWSLGDRLVFAAVNFSTAKPLHENTSMGFYDQSPVVIPTGNDSTNGGERSHVEDNGGHTQSEEPPLISKSSGKAKTKAKGKSREVFDCVLIPLRSKEDLKRMWQSTDKSVHKRVKLSHLSPPSESSSTVNQDLFLPSSSESIDDDLSDDAPGPSKRPIKPTPRVRRSPSVSSLYEVSSRSAKVVPNFNKRPIANQPGSSLGFSRPKPRPASQIIRNRPQIAWAPRGKPGPNFPKMRTGPAAPSRVRRAHPPLPGPSSSVISTTGAEILGAVQDDMLDIQRENSYFRRQISQQGQLLKQTRDQLKIAESQLSKNNAEIAKLQRKVDQQQIELADLRSAWKNLDIDPMIEGSRWMRIRLETQKRETERYVQAQFNSERQIAIIEEAVQRALGAQTPVALASTEAPSRTMNDYDRSNLSSQTELFRNPARVDKPKWNRAHNRPSRGRTDELQMPAYNSDRGYSGRQTPSRTFETARTHVPSQVGIPEGRHRRPYEAENNNHSSVAAARSGAQSPHLRPEIVRSARNADSAQGVLERASSHRSRDPRLVAHRETEELRAVQSLAERLEAPNPDSINAARNNSEEGELPSFEYPASDEMDTDEHPGPSW